MPRKLPVKKLISFRLPPDVIKTLTTKAIKQHVSRNKLTELILRDHFSRGDRHLSALIEQEPDRDDRTLDMFA